MLLPFPDGTTPPPPTAPLLGPLTPAERLCDVEEEEEEETEVAGKWKSDGARQTAKLLGVI